MNNGGNTTNNGEINGNNNNGTSGTGSTSIGGGNNSSITSHVYSSQTLTQQGQSAIDFILSTDNGSRNMKCNLAVQKYIKNVIGYLPEYLSGSANSMVEGLALSIDWVEIAGTLVEMLSEAQNRANNGYVVVAGAQDFSANPPHGHIVAILPGRLVWSTSWQMNVPSNVLECGAGRRWNNDKLSKSWISSAEKLGRPVDSPDKDDIRFFYFK